MELHGLFDADFGLNHFSQGSRLLRLETVVDASAAESVTPPLMAPLVKMG